MNDKEWSDLWRRYVNDPDMRLAKEKERQWAEIARRLRGRESRGVYDLATLIHDVERGTS